MVFPSSVPVKKLQQEHPEYKVFQTGYLATEILYEGGLKILNAVIRANMFLEKAPKELPEVFGIRQKRFSYTNLLGNVIGWYLAALFKDAPTYLKTTEGAKPDQAVQLPKEVEDFCAAFEGDADRGGLSLTGMLQKVAETCLLYRKAYMLLDLPAPEAEKPPATLKEQESGGLLNPYLVLYSPSHVINWECDSYGNLEWLVLYLRCEEQEFLEASKTIDYWYYFDRQECALYQREVKANQNTAITIEGGSPAALPSGAAEELATLAPGYPRKHALSDQNRVPVHVFELPEGLWLANRVYLPLLNHLNQDNSFDFGLFQANLPQLCIEDGTQGTYEEPATISAVGYHKIPNGGAMYYLEPEGRAYDASQKRIDNLEERIYKACYLMDQARTNRSTPTSQSGISKQLDKTPSQDAMSGIGDVLRPKIQQIYQDVLEIRGFGNILVDIRGFDFTDRATAEDLQLLEQATVIEVNSETYERELAKKTVHCVLSDANPAVLAAIDGEIDKNPTPSVLAAQQQEQQQAAMLAKFSGSLAAAGRPQ